MVYFDLFVSFVKIGFTSFGGMSMIPLILEEMQTHGWMDLRQMSDIVAIAEMTPGPLGINCATFAGTQTTGVLGGIAAVAGVLMPAFTLTLAVGILFAKIRGNSVMEDVMRFVKPICIGMIGGVIITMGKGTYLKDGNFDFASLGISAIVLFLLVKYKWSVPKVIGISAVAGIIAYGICG